MISSVPSPVFVTVAAPVPERYSIRFVVPDGTSIVVSPATGSSGTTSVPARASVAENATQAAVNSLFIICLDSFLFVFTRVASARKTQSTAGRA